MTFIFSKTLLSTQGPVRMGHPASSLVRGIVLLALASTLTACVIAPPRHVAVSASVPGVVVRVGVAPPPPLAETQPPRPAPHWIWVGGHWRWDGRRHVWEPGYWVEP